MNVIYIIFLFTYDINRKINKHPLSKCHTKDINPSEIKSGDNIKYMCYRPGKKEDADACGTVIPVQSSRHVRQADSRHVVTTDRQTDGQSSRPHDRQTGKSRHGVGPMAICNTWCARQSFRTRMFSSKINSALNK